MTDAAKEWFAVAAESVVSNFVKAFGRAPNEAEAAIITKALVDRWNEPKAISTMLH